ncbi:hypothetical protein Tco_0143611, partial [Tanacetum coccineum]
MLMQYLLNNILLPLIYDSLQSSKDAVADDADKDINGNSTYMMFTPVNATGSSYENLGGLIHVNAATFPNDDFPTDPLMADLEDTSDLLNTGIFSGAYDDEDVGAKVDLNNLETTMNVSPIPITRIYKDHPKDQIIGDINSATQTRRMIKMSEEHAMASGLLKLSYTQEEGIDYDEVFAPVARIEAIRAWYETLSAYLLENGFRRGIIDKTLFIKKDRDDAQEIPNEFYRRVHFLLRIIASTPIETNKALLKDREAEDVDVHLYRSMIGSLCISQLSRPDIMFCMFDLWRGFQVNLKTHYSLAMRKRSLDTERKLALDKIITGGCQFLGKRLISCQCKKQTIVANSTTKATDGNADFHQIVDFLNASTIMYSLTISPTIYASYIEQFWSTAKTKIVNNETQIHAKVDGKTIVISESLVRSNLQFNDEDSVTSLTNSKILENLALMGYEIIYDKLTFQKALFSPQWKYLIHTILHCLSSKSTAWNDFSTNIASAVLCLANNQKFNFYKLIFDEPFNDTYETPKHTKKVFANMRRKGKGFLGTVTPLFESKPKEVGTLRYLSLVVPLKKVGDEAVYTGEDDRVVRAATTATSLEVEQESGNIHKTQSTATLNEPSPQGTGSSSGPRCQDTTLGGAGAQTRVLSLETSKSAQDLVINKLKKKVKKLEKKQRARTSGMKLFKIGTSRRKSLDKENVSKQERNLKTRPMFEEGDFDDDIDDMVNEAIENVEGDTINAIGAVNTATTGVSTASASVTTTGVSISTTEPRTPPKTTTTAFEDKDLTIAQTLVKMRSEKDKVKGVDFRVVEESARLTTILPTIDPKDKGKGIMQEPKKPPKNPIKAQIQRDTEIAQRLFEEEQAQFEREQRIARERAAEQEAKDAVLIEQMEDIQERMDADELLAERFQQEEREQFTIEEKSRMLVEMIAERKRFFVAQRAEQIRNKPPTRAQLRNKMVTYLKHMGKYTQNQMNSKSFKEIQKLYEKEQKWINDFVLIDSEVVKDSRKGKGTSGRKKTVARKRTGEKLDDESVKRQKIEDNAEKEELRAYLDIILGDDEAVNVESLAIKYLIVNWKTHTLSKDKMYYEIIRGDRSTKFYKIFIEMLDDFDRQDVLDLYRLVKERFETA